MTNTANGQEAIERLVRTAEKAFAVERDKVKRWQIARILKDTTEQLKAYKPKGA